MTVIIWCVFLEPSELSESDVCQANETSEEEEGAAHGCATSDVPEVLTTAQFLAQRQEKLEKIKDAIASHTSQLMEDPEGNVKKKVVCVGEREKGMPPLTLISWLARAIYI